MSATELTARAVDGITSGSYDLARPQFRQSGHVRAIQRVDGALLVTADHGNCEPMRDPATGGPDTAHTTNVVPVILVSDRPVAFVDGRDGDRRRRRFAFRAMSRRTRRSRDRSPAPFAREHGKLPRRSRLAENFPANSFQAWQFSIRSLGILRGPDRPRLPARMIQPRGCPRQTIRRGRCSASRCRNASRRPGPRRRLPAREGGRGACDRIGDDEAGY